MMYAPPVLVINKNDFSSIICVYESAYLIISVYIMRVQSFTKLIKNNKDAKKPNISFSITVGVKF